MNYQRLYDRLAPVYGPAMQLLPVWRRYTEAALPCLPAGGKILEIGPGPGLLLAQLARTHPLAAGVDLSPGMLRLARRRLLRSGLAAPLTQGDAAALPFADNSFHGIVTTFVFSAIPNGPAAMQEMARVLRPGGTLALVDAGIPPGGNFMAVALAKMWELFGDFIRDEAALMQAAGLAVVERRDFGAFNSIRLVVGRK